MERQVIHRDRQEVTQNDLNNAQLWGDEAQRNLTQDAITTQRQFTGLTLTIQSATEVAVAPGRLWEGPTGKVFSKGILETVSVYDNLPLQDERWLAISAYGQEEDTNVEPRDYIIDVQTGQTEPQMVAMERRRIVMIHKAVGLESPTPERPEPPTGYLLLGHVRMSPSGIQEVVLADQFRLPNLHNVNQQVKQINGWILSTEPRIASIQTDIAALGEAINTRATISQILQVARDMAAVKERLEMPDNYVFYGADHFLDESESDTEHVDYSARCDEGLRPPMAASASLSLALANPLDPAARQFASGFLLPAHTEVTRLRMETMVGNIQINNYPVETHQIVQRHVARQRIQYGQTRTICTNTGFWALGTYDAATGIFRYNTGETWEIAPESRANFLNRMGHVRMREAFVTTVLEPYWDTVTTTHNIQNSIVAQNFLSAQTGWMTSIELYFTAVSGAGGLTLDIVNAPEGAPDLGAGIAHITLAANALNAGWCKITLPEPVYIEAGSRYAIVLSTGAAHRVGYTDGTEYTQGTLFYGQDGQFTQMEADRDLMLRLNFARFANPRTVIQFNSLQLAGGIGDIDLLYEGITPDGCELIWQYQIAGIWYSMRSGTAENLAALSNLIPLRAVFLGTTDLMPGIRTTDSQIVVARPDDEFTHISTERTLASASDDIRVRLLLEDFSSTPHTVACQLIIDGTPVNPTSTFDEIVDGRSRWREYRFELGSPESAYQIKITGSTTAWNNAWHVAERFDAAL